MLCSQESAVIKESEKSIYFGPGLFFNSHASSIVDNTQYVFNTAQHCFGGSDFF